MTVPYKIIPELENVFSIHPWLLSDDLSDDEVLDKLGDASFHYLIKYHSRLEMKMIHPIVQKAIYNVLHAKEIEKIKEHRKIIEHYDDYDGDGDNSWDGYTYEESFVRRQIRYAKELKSLPERYLNEEDKAYINEITLRKLLD